MSVSPPPSYSSNPREDRETTLEKSKKRPSKGDRHEKADEKSVEEKEEEKKTRSRLRPAKAYNRESATNDTLKLIAGDRIRRSRCDPEFLEEMAKGGADHIKVIRGAEARKYFKSFAKENGGPGDTPAKVIEADDDIPPPVVFAVTVLDAGRRVVDYYMSWRGKTQRTRHLRGMERRLSMLDSEFKRVAKTLDKEFKRAASTRGSSISPSQASVKEGSPPSSKSSSPVRQEEAAPPPLVEPITIPEAPASARDSVTSLPLLNMIRNVPFSNRLRLRVTNPDTASISSSASIRESVIVDIPPATSLETLVETDESGKSAATVAPTTENIKTPETPISGDCRPNDSRNERIMTSSVSRASSESSSGGTYRDRKGANDDVSSEFLIVLLDDDDIGNKDKDKATEPTQNRKSDGINNIPVRKPSARTSPWIGPLVHSDGITYRSPPSRRAPSLKPGDDSSDEEGGWKDSPVIPMKSLMMALGYIPPDPPRLHIPVAPRSYTASVPSASYTAPYTAPHNSPYSSPYGRPHSQLTPSSPYVPAWISSPSHIPNTPLSRSGSHGGTDLGYYSPYVHPQYQ